MIVAAEAASVAVCAGLAIGGAHAGRALSLVRPVAWARNVWRFGRTCVRAAKLLPTVRRAVPWFVWPILALAAAVKCLPVDMGADEALFTVAALLIAWRRPGLLRALYREAQNGRPVRCSCPRHTRRAR